MASGKCRFETFKKSDIDIAGMVSILKSKPIVSQLTELTSTGCAAANARAHVSGRDRGGVAYTYKVRMMGFVPIGAIETNTMFGRIDQATHHTLDSLNH